MVHEPDDPRSAAAGAGLSPTDPGGPTGDRGPDDGSDTDDDLVSAVEDLVRDLLPDDGLGEPPP